MESIKVKLFGNKSTKGLFTSQSEFVDEILKMQEKANESEEEKRKYTHSGLSSYFSQILKGAKKMPVKLENYVKLVLERKAIDDESIKSILHGLNNIQIIEPNHIKDTNLEILKLLGIETAKISLDKSGYSPEECLKDDSIEYLDLMGSSGLKWLVDENEFESFLTKVQTKIYGEVRFLLINPKSKKYSELKKMRADNSDSRTLEKFYELTQKYTCFKVRYYDNLPTFRLLFVNREKLICSMYHYNEEKYAKSKKGWNVPQLIIDKDAEWSMYNPFAQQFQETWNEAKTIDEIINIEDGN